MAAAAPSPGRRSPSSRPPEAGGRPRTGRGEAGRPRPEVRRAHPVRGRHLPAAEVLAGLLPPPAGRSQDHQRGGAGTSGRAGPGPLEGRSQDYQWGGAGTSGRAGPGSPAGRSQDHQRAEARTSGGSSRDYQRGGAGTPNGAGPGLPGRRSQDNSRAGPGPLAWRGQDLHTGEARTSGWAWSEPRAPGWAGRRLMVGVARLLAREDRGRVSEHLAWRPFTGAGGVREANSGLRYRHPGLAARPGAGPPGHKRGQ